MNSEMSFSALNNGVTILAYHFWADDGYEDAFAKVVHAFEETWKCCGELKSVLVVNQVKQCVERFAAEHGNLEIQVEPSLTPGKIFTMSADCNSRLYTRFSTPYVLIIQNDGWPLRQGLEEFVGKWDFIGAPYVRDIWWKRLAAWMLNYHPMNGGFSLRSRRCCEQVAHYWNTKYHTLGDCLWSSEDLFVTDFLPKHERKFRRAMRFPEIVEALRFSFENISAYKRNWLPFGFHRMDSLSAIEKPTRTSAITRVIRRFGYKCKEACRLFSGVNPNRKLASTFVNSSDLRVALVAIARNEDDYIREWVDYHRALGFDAVFIYQNEWRCSALRDGGCIHLIPFDGNQMQLNAYNDFLWRRSSGFDFAAFIDIDEFIVSDRYKSIQEICGRYLGYEAVGLNWKIFGDSGIPGVVNGNFSCLSRFTQCARAFDHHIKTIVNLHADKYGMRFGDPHSVCRGTDVTLSVTADCKHRTYASFNDFPIHPDVWINHYAVKTRQEFIENKCKRGRADTPRDSVDQNRNMKYFEQYNCNETESMVAYEFARRHHILMSTDGKQIN